jgi:hypothetical protein
MYSRDWFVQHSQRLQPNESLGGKITGSIVAICDTIAGGGATSADYDVIRIS